MRGNLKELQKNGGLSQRITLNKLDIAPILTKFFEIPRMEGAKSNDYENRG